jgi:hypothetical protein
LRLLEQVDRLRVREVLLGLAERRGLQDFGAGQQIGDDPLLPLEPAQADGLGERILCSGGGDGGGGSGGGTRDHLFLQVLRDGGEAEVAMTVEVEEATEAARAHLALKHLALGVFVAFEGDATATSGTFFAFSGRNGRAVEVREALWRQDGSSRCLFLLLLSILPMKHAHRLQ